MRAETVNVTVHPVGCNTYYLTRVITSRVAVMLYYITNFFTRLLAYIFRRICFFGLTRLVCRLAIWLNILLCFVENVLFRIELEAFSEYFTVRCKKIKLPLALAWLQTKGLFSESDFESRDVSHPCCKKEDGRFSFFWLKVNI